MKRAEAVRIIECDKSSWRKKECDVKESDCWRELGIRNSGR
jgi:hypothetical protein